MAENKELTTQEKTGKKAGFATIIGKPNVGKSTLMNRLIGQKIAITSYKPQTTRTQVRTILTEDRGQVVFLDTPGIHRTKTRMGEYMVKAAQSTLKEVDVVLWLVEPKTKMSEEDKSIARQLAAVKTPVLILINKIDSVKKAEILPVIAVYQKAYDEAVQSQNEERAAAGGRFALNQDEDKLYAAEITEAPDAGFTVTEELIKQNFRVLYSEWITGD